MSDNYYNVLNSTKLKFQDAAEIVKSFVDNANNFQQLQQFLKKNARLFQYAYANLFPEYFSRSDDYGIHSKLEFENVFKNWVTQKNLTIGWQYPILNMKTEENLSEIVNPPTLLNDEKINFEKIEVVEDGTAKEKIKRRRKNNPPSKKKNKKTHRKKTNLKLISKRTIKCILRLIIKIINKL